LRKSVSLLGTRFTLSRRGIGASWRFPGFQIGVTADGRRYWSFGIPGTGLFWIKHF
jgi:hypothetical protein